MIAEREARQLSADGLRLWDLYKRNEHAHLLNEVDVLSKGGPLSADVLGLASLSLSALERWQEAVGAATRAAGAGTHLAWLHGALAMALAGSGNLSGALAAQQRARQLAPADPQHGALLAKYLRLLGQAREACRAAREALVIDSEHIPALNELALSESMLHTAAGQRTAARRALRGALERRPGWAEAEDALARTLPGTRGVGGMLLGHVLTLGRVTLVGWLMIAFLYYLLFRLLEFGWKLAPALLPIGQTLLVITLAYLLVGLAVGRLLRWLLNRGWPR